MEMLNPKNPIRRPINRRQLLKSTAALTVSSFLLGPSGQALASAVSADGSDGQSENIQYPSANFKIDAFVATPNGEGVHPSVIVIHDDGGLNDGVREVARRFAAAGFLAMAPDLLSRSGGTKQLKDTDKVAEAIDHVSPDATLEDLRAGYGFLRESVNPKADKVSVVGLGWGGWRAYLLAENVTGISRAVVYSGNAPSGRLHEIEASCLAHYGQFDFRNAGNALWLEKELGKRFAYYVYPGVDHGFYDDASPQYNPDAAKLAWSRTLEFLRSAS